MIGWCISTVAWRDTDDGTRIWTRPFTAGRQYSHEEAEAYAVAEISAIWPPSLGWRYIAVAMPIYEEP